MIFVLTSILWSCIFVPIAQSQQSNLVCTNEFCNNYKEMTGCGNLAEPCSVQNSTHSGQIFPSATPCSCCEICLEHLREGDFCTVGAPGSPVPTTICGPGLKCRSNNDNDHPTCVKMDDTDCFKQQIAFDIAKENGKVGKLMQRPACDGEGFFKPLKCIPDEICYCLDKNGNRIFGEDVYSPFAELTMNCECSRIATTYKQLMPSRYPQLTSRCLDDGSFDSLQCFLDRCVCVHKIYGGTVDDQIFDIGIGINHIPCYDRRLHRSRTIYEHECEQILADKLSEVYKFESQGFNIIEFTLDMCEVNGWYKRVQEDKDSKFCVDNFGSKIGNYTVPKSSPLAVNMNCHCARANFLISNPKECCPNGNYPKVVCKNEECYCLDENGNQVSIEVQVDEITTLSCYNDGVFC